MSDTTNSFRLDIEFAGMCLFVRDLGPQQMHVLLPPVDGHLARLFYAPEHGSAAPCDSGTRWPCESLAGLALDLTGLTPGASITRPVDDSVVDLSTFLGGKTVPRRHLDDPPPADPVLCRVTLDDGDRDSLKPGISWVFGPGRRQMAISLTWRIFGVQAPLRLTLGSKTLELVPEHGQMRLAIFNAPADELPDSTTPFPGPTDPVQHFKKYYDFFDGVEPGQKQVPEDPEKDLPDPVIDWHKGRRFTCIAAQAAAAP